MKLLIIIFTFFISLNVSAQLFSTEFRIIQSNDLSKQIIQDKHLTKWKISLDTIVENSIIHKIKSTTSNVENNNEYTIYFFTDKSSKIIITFKNNLISQIIKEEIIELNYNVKYYYYQDLASALIVTSLLRENQKNLLELKRINQRIDSLNIMRKIETEIIEQNKMLITPPICLQGDIGKYLSSNISIQEVQSIYSTFFYGEIFFKINKDSSITEIKFINQPACCKFNEKSKEKISNILKATKWLPAKNKDGVIVNYIVKCDIRIFGKK